MATATPAVTKVPGTNASQFFPDMSLADVGDGCWASSLLPGRDGLPVARRRRDTSRRSLHELGVVQVLGDGLLELPSLELGPGPRDDSASRKGIVQAVLGTRAE